MRKAFVIGFVAWILSTILNYNLWFWRLRTVGNLYVLPYWAERARFLNFISAASDWNLLNFYTTFYYVHGYFQHGHTFPYMKVDRKSLEGIVKKLKSFALNLVDVNPFSEDAYYYLGLILPTNLEFEKWGKTILIQATGYLRGTAKPYEWLAWAGRLYTGNMKWTLKFAKKAMEYPDCSISLISLSAFLEEYLKGDYKKAMDYFQKAIDKALEENYKERANSLAKHFARLMVQNLIQQAVKTYKKLYGRNPDSVTELVEVGILKEYPKDPFGRGFVIDDGKVVWKGTERWVFLYRLRKKMIRERVESGGVGPHGHHHDEHKNDERGTEHEH